MTFPSKKDAIDLIIRKVPKAAINNNLLVLMYWKVVENIDIPPKIIEEIVKRGTSPETITRSRRKAMEKIRRMNNERSKSGTA